MAKLTKAAIAERNRKFMRLGKKQRFVQVAKDALAQVAIGKYITETGNYFSESEGEFSADAMDSPKHFQIELLAKTSPVCEVCARGALFLSRARCGNTVEYDAAGDDPFLPDAPHEVLFLLEQFFESWIYECKGKLVGVSDEVRSKESDRLARLHGYDSKSILEDILSNVIRNRGDYVTPNRKNLTKATWDEFIKESRGKRG